MSTRRPRTPPDRSARVEEQMTFDNVTAALGYVPGVAVTGASIAYVDAGDAASASALAAHVAAGDPHPGYLTPAEGNAAYDPIGAAAAVVVDSIADADTTRAPSRNAVFDALAGKETAGAAAAAQAAAQAFATAADTALLTSAITNADTTHAPSGDAVFDALALKQDADAQLTSLAGLSYTGNTLKVVRVNAAETAFELATPAASGQAAIQFKDEGVNVGSSGAITSLDVVGAGGTLAVVGTAATLTLSAGGAGAMTSLGTATVTGAAATTLTLTPSSALSASKGWYIAVSLKNATASTSNVSLYFNADTTATNYYENYLNVANTAVAAARANDGIAMVLDVSACCTGLIEIVRDRDGRPRSWIRSMRGAAAGIAWNEIIHIRNNTADVTSITISASVASSLSIGDTFTVFGVT